ncbi:MAG: bacillithiol biosynthesis deacetylase BshB1 [Acidobacteria bacterium]|nr:bacillithiol biosynthesis deacetylase BshB1 [Acidobacteriota bacterium]MBU1474187.1 bacillithiol biosynthesis deacetylase BshB1 [Acidobacteriota bacterium]MCG2815423.1 bacillithiol biosynthesis deacetylase BshB1 [Candidatus Aminicenantes bacterium]
MKLDALAFGAHADDVEMACSGTIIKLGASGYRTGVIALTRGEMATRGSAEIRAQEFAQSAEVMGLAYHRMLDIPDGRIEVTWENKIKIIQEIRTHQPRIVFAPYWVTRHPDHEQTSRLIREAAYLSGLKKLDTDQEPYRPYKVIFYQTRFEFKPSFIVDISDHHEQKMKAILSYQTQLSSPDFLDRIVTRDKQCGTYIGVKYGEPFLVRDALKIDDLVDFFGPEYLETIP